ncbi:MAG: M56 family metallopeptidase [Streptosporangiaceae bacterium]
MHIAVYLPLLAPITAALFAERLSRRLAPRLATWLLTASAVLLAGAWIVVLSLLVIVGLIQIPVVARLAEVSPRLLREGEPPSVAAAVTAFVVWVVALTAAGRAARRRIRGLLAASEQARDLAGNGDLVIIEDDMVADAFTLPGRPGRIVVSTGMLAALDEPQRAVLLAHERAHLRSHHHRFSTAAQLAAAANPLLRPLARAVAFTIERWADEAASEACGDRRLVARTVANAATARARLAQRTSPGIALGMADDLDHAGPVPRRVAALLSDPPRRRLNLVLCTASLVAGTGFCALDAVSDLGELIVRARG